MTDTDVFFSLNPAEPWSAYPLGMPALTAVAVVERRTQLVLWSAAFDLVAVGAIVAAALTINQEGFKLVLTAKGQIDVINHKQAVAGPGSGLFVAGVLLAGWAGLALWVWGRDRLPAELEAAEDTTTPEVAP